MGDLRSSLAWLARTPLHPQWLLGRRSPPKGVDGVSGRILDIGAADCWIKPSLREGVEYVALDYPATGRDMYRARPAVFGDGAHLPFADECFDGVVCLEVLDHVSDPALVVAEIGRVLRSGGRAWISMPFLYPLHDAPYDFQRYTEYGLRRDALRAGLDVVRLHKSGHSLRAAGLLVCLAIAGGAYAKRGWLKWVMLSLALLDVPAINIAAWVASLIWPDWSHMAMGHELEVRKP